MLALQPLYALPVDDHYTLTLRLPCGRALDLEVHAGVTRGYGVWRLRGALLCVVSAGEC